MNNQGNVAKANIVMFFPENAEKDEPLPANTFSKLLTYQKVPFDGRYAFVSITDQYFYEISFKNGDLYSGSVMRSK